MNDHQSAGQLAAEERRVTWEFRLYGWGNSIRSHSGGEPACKRRPQHRMASRANPSPYGVLLSGVFGDELGLIDGESDWPGDGDVSGGKAFAITSRILAIVVAFRYAG